MQKKIGKISCQPLAIRRKIWYDIQLYGQTFGRTLSGVGA